MRTLLAVALLAVLALAALLAMRAGWVRRERRTYSLLPALPPVPAVEHLGAVRQPPVALTYVSTSTGGEWLERVVAHGLGSPCAAVVTVHDAGVSISRVGAPALFIPAAAVRGVDAVAGVAGKVTGGRRLLRLRWQWGSATLDTGLLPRRDADRTNLMAALRTLSAADANEEVA